jgi:hypothetical protein
MLAVLSVLPDVLRVDMQYMAFATMTTDQVVLWRIGRQVECLPEAVPTVLAWRQWVMYFHVPDKPVLWHLFFAFWTVYKYIFIALFHWHLFALSGREFHPPIL